MKRLDKHLYTFTKEWVDRLMWMFCIWISLSYVLAFMGKESIAEELSTNVMIGGVAVFAGYMLKAFFETYSEENLKYKAKLNKLDKASESGEEEPTEAETEDE